jgi:hypothetical protein
MTFSPYAKLINLNLKVPEDTVQRKKCFKKENISLLRIIHDGGWALLRGSRGTGWLGRVWSKEQQSLKLGGVCPSRKHS